MTQSPTLLNSPPVRYLPAAEIERRAARLLADYQQQRGAADVLPVPIDEIVELHLQLRLEITNLSQRLAIPGVLGALYRENRCIAIDASLDPNNHPAQEGRYRFTLAHEVGHWQLHRSIGGVTLLELATEQITAEQRVRTHQRIELQANLFASCLLMPRRLVRAVWRELRGTDGPFCVEEAAKGGDYLIMRTILRSTLGSERDAEDVLLERFSRPFARRFRVSGEAMRIRLEQLGLIVRPEAAIHSDS
ncbi:MAG: ImmA/IrrE family metallo-endopeptidase [Phycisphaerae bacterium]|nr:ImmA/IrrE family metallo-endopeptidase [Phycisphaerae bacterium]